MCSWDTHTHFISPAITQTSDGWHDLPLRLISLCWTALALVNCDSMLIQGLLHVCGCVSTWLKLLTWIFTADLENTQFTFYLEDLCEECCAHKYLLSSSLSIFYCIFSIIVSWWLSHLLTASSSILWNCSVSYDWKHIFVELWVTWPKNVF